MARHANENQYSIWLWFVRRKFKCPINISENEWEKSLLSPTTDWCWNNGLKNDYSSNCANQTWINHLFQHFKSLLELLWFELLFLSKMLTNFHKRQLATILSVDISNRNCDLLANIEIRANQMPVTTTDWLQHSKKKRQFANCVDKCRKKGNYISWRISWKCEAFTVNVLLLYIGADKVNININVCDSFVT